ncbi:MAG: M42 family metallopeptidase [Culicoidibacterales bacterium]
MKVGGKMLTPQEQELYKTLTELPGTSGFEHEVRKFMHDELTKTSETIVRDRLGSIFGVKAGTDENPLRIVVAGHMDEVGFMVTQITDNGMIRFQTIGGWWNQTMLGHRVSVHTREGILPGTIGSIPTHLLTPEQLAKPMEIKQMLIDIGAQSREEAVSFGVRPGDQIIMDGAFTPLAGNERFMAKAWDNRLGCGLALETMAHFQDIKLPHTLICGATVQEEVGLRGAKTAAALTKPDFAIVVDVSPANDATGDKNQFGQLGDGVLIRIHDRTMVMSQPMLDYVLETCEKYDINHQYFISPGGTDAGNFHLHETGVPTISICLSARYIHCSSSIIDSRDYQAAKQLVFKLIEDFSSERFAQLLPR